MQCGAVDGMIQCKRNKKRKMGEENEEEGGWKGWMDGMEVEKRRWLVVGGVIELG